MPALPSQLLSTDGVVFARDAEGNLAFPLRLVSGLEAVVIGARSRLQNFKGEWFLDLSAGVAWLATEDGVIQEKDAILGPAFDEIKVRAELLRELLTTPGIIDVPVLRCSFDAPNRKLSIAWQARTAFGDTPLDIVTRVI